MFVVVHYSEIGTKGKNRIFFEKKLVENLKKALDKNLIEIYRRYGRIVCELKENSDMKKIIIIIKRVPGVYSFLFCQKSFLDLGEMKKVSLEILKNKDFESFKIKSSRSNKKFNKTSQELNELIGEYIVKNLNKKVDLKKPEVTLYVEVCEKEAFIGCEKYKGLGGLPVGSSGKLISSLSGGIDSPVASFLMMKRGCRIVFLHIYNSTQINSLTLKKLEDIVKQLTKFQLNSKLYIVPFEKIQKEIIMNVHSKFRMIVYRRFMIEIINEVAKKEKAGGIVTGDSLGQVASQTIENLNCIYSLSSLPIFTPLIGLNKDEIIKLAKKIGTYKYSIEPYPDCCSFMIAKHPETKGKLEEIKKLESFIEEKNKLIQDSIKNAIIKFYSLK